MTDSMLPACTKCGLETQQYHDASGAAVPGVGVCVICCRMTNQTSGWLGLGRLKGEKFGDANEDEMRFVEFSGVMRGVQKVDFGKLARALTMHVIPLTGNAPDEPNFLVTPTDGSTSDWSRFYPEDGEGEYVNLYDRQVDRCHCQDFIWRGETNKTLCSHILAALIFEQHPAILPLLDELKTRNAIAKAVTA